MFKEEYVIILDYLPRGYASSYKREPIAQALGEKYFSLLELVMKPDVRISLHDRVYIGDEKRDQVQFIKGRLLFPKLTTTAKKELRMTVEEIVKKEEERFIDFFNRTGPITVRQHSLELLPGIGKKHMWDIINEREKKPFKSYADLTARVHLMPDPQRVLIERILEELEGKAKYNLLTRPAPRGEERQFKG